MGDKLYQRLGWQPRCKPTVLEGGRILLPLYSDTYSFSIMAISDDGGETWFASEPLMGFGSIQPAVLQRRDGTLVAYMRENGPRDQIRMAESTDDGLTWGPVGVAGLPNPGSGLDGIVLASGAWLLIYNDTIDERISLAVSLSDDEGRTWATTRHLEQHETGAYHYPAVIQGRDGTIHAVYSYFVEGGKSMKHAGFNEGLGARRRRRMSEKPRPRRKLWRVVLATLCLVLCGGALFVWSLRARPAQGGEPPPGYLSTNLIMLAIASGQLSLVDRELPVSDSVDLARGVEYGRGGENPLQLDLYTPGGLDRDVPGLIFIHGGGWKGGERGDYQYYGVRFAEQGYVVASISYRLREEARFPACVEDAKCAVRWMRTNAASLHVDPERIAVIGGSAGGHLSLMVGYSADADVLEGTGGHNGVSSRVAAVVDLYGPVDLTTPYARTHDLVTDFIGQPYEDASELYELASPLTHVTEDDPPTLIFHGTLDDLVFVRQSDWLAARLDEAGVPHRYERLEGWPHTMDAAQVVNDYCVECMLEFFEEHLTRTPARQE